MVLPDISNTVVAKSKKALLMPRNSGKDAVCVALALMNNSPIIVADRVYVARLESKYPHVKGLVRAAYDYGKPGAKHDSKVILNDYCSYNLSTRIKINKALQSHVFDEILIVSCIQSMTKKVYDAARLAKERNDYEILLVACDFNNANYADACESIFTDYDCELIRNIPKVSWIDASRCELNAPPDIFNSEYTVEFTSSTKA